MEWQPIETAPRDGTAIFVWATREGWRDNPRMVAARWYHSANSWYVYGCGPTKHSEQWLDSCNPTHWMPLPPPPNHTPSQGKEQGTCLIR